MYNHAWGEGFAIGVITGMFMLMIFSWAYGVSCS